MRLKKSIPLILMLFCMPLFAQVQLFEQDASGIVPKVGLDWNSKISSLTAGFEYTIEGRTTLGFTYTHPLKDTLAFDPNLKATGYEPYAIFEFVEPSSANTFSFATKLGFSYYDAPHINATDLNSFSRYLIHGGPMFGFRILAAETFAFIPTVAYDLSIGKSRTNNLNPPSGNPIFNKSDLVWHDFVGACPMLLKLNEFNGLVFEPRLDLKIGKGLSTNDFINASASFGYVLTF